MLVDYSDDKELLEVLKCGKISAFEYIYTTYYDSLLNYADRLLNDLDISLSVKAYLFKSVYHACLNTLAHKKNIQKYEREQLADLYFSNVIQSPEAEMELWQADVAKALDEAIALLPEKCREVFVLSKVEGYVRKVQ